MAQNTVTAQAGRKPKKQKQSQFSGMSRALVRRETISAYLFQLPSLIFFLGFVIIHMVICIFNSFTAMSFQPMKRKKPLTAARMELPVAGAWLVGTRKTRVNVSCFVIPKSSRRFVVRNTLVILAVSSWYSATIASDTGMWELFWCLPSQKFLPAATEPRYPLTILRGIKSIQFYCFIIGEILILFHYFLSIYLSRIILKATSRES